MQQHSTAGFQLSPQQKHAWERQESGHTAAAQLVQLLEGKLESERLQQALSRVIERHEILRTSFQRSSGMKFPFQVVNVSATLDWKALPWSQISSSSAASPHEIEIEKQRVIGSLLLEGSKFAMLQSPIVHARLIKMPSNAQHLLLLSLPAMSADGASLNNLSIELLEEYSGQHKDQSDPLQYADFAEWQNDLLRKNDGETQAAKQFWAQYDLAFAPKLALPFEIKSKTISAFNPQSIALPAVGKYFDPMSADAADFALACWQVLLWRLTGQTVPLIGYVSDGRSQDELKKAVGLFSKALPFQIDFEQDLSFHDLLEKVKQQRTHILEWQDYFSPEAIGSNMTIGFSVQEQQAKHALGDVSWSVYDRQYPTHGFQIELRCTLAHDSWQAGIIYDPVYFGADAIQRLASQFTMLCGAASADPNVSVSKLPILDEDERQKVVVVFNRTAADYSRDKCIQQLFEEQAAHIADRPALRFGNEAFSYGELNARANQLAHYLIRRGVGPNVAVGLYVERSAEMIIGLLAILKAGGCYVPLVPDSPKSRLAHQLKETSAPVVLTQSKLLEQLPEFKGEVICFDRDNLKIGEEPKANPERSSSDNDTVYVIYTSGSTGNPKGVEVRHSSLVNYSQFIVRLLGLERNQEGLNFATVSTISADLGNTCIFPSLISGGCLHVVPYETAMAPDRFAAYTSEHPIDVLKITPSHLGTLLNSSEGAAVLPRRYLILGGEALSWHLVSKVQQTGKCKVLNHYGPTEATVGCCTFDLQKNDASAWAPTTVPIGRPIANDEVYIVDSRLQPVPIGVPGELCIGGTGLAKGYLNQPNQTAERFVQNPFSSDASARIYRTGDLARFLPDGNIEFLGRIDQQVKIRGFRVEPAEIESVLKQHPAVKRSAVIPYQDKTGERRLAAYVVPSGALKEEQLREFLLQQLPEYMVPSAFAVVNALPLTANGKIDIRALPPLDEVAGKRKRDYVGPQNPEEEKLIGIWTEVLKIEQIGINDNFFELGGHSLLATQIISRIRNQFRVQLPLHSFLETPTIANLAQKISRCPVAESEQEEMARLLQELEGISDEEAERILAAEYKKGDEIV